MDLFKEEIENEKKEFNALSLRSKRRNLRQLPQVGTTSVDEDKKRKALLSGKRISRNGNTYWETRKNRSDQKGSMV